MPEKIIDPAVLSSISHLEIIAKEAVEGAVSGLHHSHYMGRNVEFSEHRPYNMGDELRHIDWRVYAKTDRFHVKLFEEDTNLRATILVDRSGSMRFGESTVTKESYAQQLCAAFSHLMLRQGDRVGVMVFDNQARAFIPPNHKQDQWPSILETLANTPMSDERTSLSNVLHSMGEQLKKRGMIFVISDLIDDPQRVISNLSVLRKRKQEIVVFQILTPEEMDLPYHGTVEFLPLEQDIEALQTMPKRLKKSYCDKVQRFINSYRENCLEAGIDYNLIRTDQSLEIVLRDYLQKRMKKAS